MSGMSGELDPAMTDCDSYLTEKEMILQEKIDMPSLYFTHERQVFQRDGQWLAAEPCIKLKPTEQVDTKQVRCRTIGDTRERTRCSRDKDERHCRNHHPYCPTLGV